MYKNCLVVLLVTLVGLLTLCSADIPSSERKALCDIWWNFHPQVWEWSGYLPCRLEVVICDWEGSQHTVDCNENGTHVTFLSLANLNVSGVLPDSIGDLTSLIFLHLENNYIEGTIPESIGNLRDLHVLFLSNNNLRGPLPKSMVNLGKLSELNVSLNYLTGDLSFISSLNSLRFLDVSDNDFSKLSCDVSHLNMSRVDLGYNSFKEPLPLFNETIRYLHLAGNFFSGTINENYCKWKSLTFLDLHNNLLEGRVPDCLSDLTSLQLLDLGENGFTQLDVSIFCKLTELKSLSISSNPLTSVTIPDCIGDLSSLSIIHMSRCGLTGSISPSLSELHNLTSFDVSGNSLSGKLPDFKNMTMLNIIDLSNNPDLSDVFPQDLIDLPVLFRLDLSNTSISGQLPDGICDSAFYYLNFNNSKVLRDRSLCNCCTLSCFCDESTDQPVVLIDLFVALAVTSGAAIIVSLILFLWKRSETVKSNKDVNNPLLQSSDVIGNDDG